MGPGFEVALSLADLSPPHRERTVPCNRNGGPGKSETHPKSGPTPELQLISIISASHTLARRNKVSDAIRSCGFKVADLCPPQRDLTVPGNRNKFQARARPTPPTSGSTPEVQLPYASCGFEKQGFGWNPYLRFQASPGFEVHLSLADLCPPQRECTAPCDRNGVTHPKSGPTQELQQIFIGKPYASCRKRRFRAQSTLAF
jgi:hypothetical protein